MKYLIIISLFLTSGCNTIMYFEKYESLKNTVESGVFLPKGFKIKVTTKSIRVKKGKVTYRYTTRHNKIEFKYRLKF